PEGKSLHKSFLRSPLEFSRISSGFSLGRFHPILQTMRAHKGVDYAAPIGTRIKASADGHVAFVGTKGGYGNVIMLQHQNGVTTVYGHLSRFVAGLRQGMKVSQGDIIGFVGMSGLATGPHLHYEFLLHGQHRDPLKVALPQAVPITAKYQADFLAKSAALTAQLNILSASRLAALE
ncbi:MAG TPA: M23 family metallopeptidase, partial [Methylophilaceae bacterium]|nr:M23 family metallopeptidase [Methylophilaceae bacterium]